MVKTRELCWTLVKVLGRASGTEVSGEADEVPRRRRMTSFARRQRAATPITKDGEHLDHAADGVHEQPQEPIIDDVCADVQDFLGRSHDTSVLTDYVYHVTTRV